jgi:tRNA nucleotidyltransferase (CCA-adding enzyme)
VRDLFLGRPGVDIDITVEGDGVTFAEQLAKITRSEVESFTRFGTSIVIVPGFGKVDVATTRTESYEKPGALPKVEKSGIVQDLYRRDFSINSMALSLSPSYFLRLLDPFGGVEDLKRGRVRALHEKSFIDDPTRIFRAVRFEQRFRTRIEEKTQKWLLAAVRGDYIQKVSGERLRNELRLIFQEPHPEGAVRRLDELGVLPHIHPSLGVSKQLKKVLPHIANAIVFFRLNKIALDEEKMVWFQALLSPSAVKDAAALCKRLMLSRVEQKIVTQSVKAYPALYKELNKEEASVSRSPSPILRRKLAGYFEKLQKSEPWIRGRDLQAMGVPPGFRYSFILLEALNGQLDGKFKNRKEALEWVKKAFAS